MVNRKDHLQAQRPRGMAGWLPILIGVLLCTLVGAIVWTLEQREQESLAQEIRGEVRNMAAHLQSDLRNRVSTFQRMARRWELRGGTPEDEFISDGRSYIADSPGIQALQRVDREYVVRWVVPLDGNEATRGVNLASEQKRRAALDKSRETRSPTLTPPVDLLQGGKGFLIYLPIYVRGEFDGFIAAVFRIQEWLEHVLDIKQSDVAENFKISASFDGIRVFEQPGWADLREFGMRGAAEFRIVDRRASLWIRPTKAFLDQNKTLLPMLTAIFGFLLSLFVAISAYLLQKSSMESWQTQSAKAALESEVREREKTEKELQYTLRRLDLATQAGGIAVWTWDLPSGALTWNERNYELFEVPTDVRPTYETWRNAVHPEDLPATESLLKKAIEGKAVFNTEYRIVLPSGGVRHLAAAASVERDQNGAVQCLTGIAWDLTARKETEERLRATEDRLRKITDSAPDAILMMDSQGRITYWNLAAERILGYRSEEALGKDLHLLLAPERYVAAYRAGLPEFQRTGRGHVLGTTIELFARHKDGREIAVALSLSSILQYGEWYALGIIRDITERKMAEDLLSAERRRLAYILEGTNAGTWEWNVQTGETVFNERWAAIIGYTLDELTPVSIETWRGFAHPEDLDRSAELLEKHFSGQLPYYECEIRMRHKSGEWIWVLDRGKVMTRTDDGKPLIMSGTHQDITARRRMEDELRMSRDRLAATVEAIPDLLFEVDEEGNFLNVHARDESLLALPRSELPGKNIREVLPPEAASIALEALRAAGQNGTDYGRIMKLTLEHGEFWFELSVARKAGAPGESPQFITLSRDISERKRYEHELERSRDSAETANRAKSEFLSTMSHEIRTPMNAIIGMAELLTETPLTPEQAKYVDVFRNAGENLLNIINDILDLSKIEAGQMDIEAVDMNLEDLIGRACEVMSHRANEKGLDFLCRILPDVPVSVVGDPVRMRQVLVNLLGNAVKFTEKGEVVLEVRKESEDRGSNRVRLLFSVRDSGIGIPEEKLETVFEKFTQADSSTTRRYGGTGLGLSISKRLVKLMGGELRVQSRPGEGSRFYFALSFSLQRDRKEEKNESHDIDLRGLRVLIIDDSATNRMVLKEMLGGWGFGVGEAVDGESGIRELKRGQGMGNPYELILLDYRMPMQDGLTVAERIRGDAELEKIRIVMLTSDPAYGISAKTQELRVDACLPKPVRRSQLKQAILTALGSNRSPAQERTPSGAEFPDALKRLRLLLVDDSEDNRLLILSFLKSYPCTIHVAENGSAGLHLFKQGEYDLVLMDMQMPIMDGYTATREIRAWEQQNGSGQTPVIALSAYALKDEVQKSLDAGCNGYLTKPIKKATLLEAIERYGPNRDVQAGTGRVMLPGEKGFDGKADDRGITVLIDRELEDLVPDYIENRRKDAVSILSTLERGDYDAIRVLGHKMKGSGSGYGFVRITEIGAEIETAAKRKDTEAIRECVEELKSYLERIEVQYGSVSD